jgi:ABC-type multidrug transport system fused ATPase/permease subunit
VDRVYDIFRTSPEIRLRPSARARTIKQGHLEFENVSFRYVKAPVFKDVSFTVEPGEHVLITGPSGCGKSTLLNLIPRFYDGAGGRILIDGIEHTEFTLASLRLQIGFVFQDCFLFSSSVLENIRYVRPDATDAEVVAAAQRALAHEFISQLPEGYLTVLGEQGVQLSLGERLRIGIARAVLKNPRIFILDDALAPLDPESREKLAAQLIEYGRDKTMLIVTHHPSLFPDVHKEIRFENGEVKTYVRLDEFEYAGERARATPEKGLRVEG